MTSYLDMELCNLWMVDGGQSLGLLRSVGTLIRSWFWISTLPPHVSDVWACAMLERKTQLQDLRAIQKRYHHLHDRGHRDFLSLPCAWAALPNAEETECKSHLFSPSCSMISFMPQVGVWKTCTALSRREIPAKNYNDRLVTVTGPSFWSAYEWLSQDLLLLFFFSFA